MPYARYVLLHICTAVPALVNVLQYVRGMDSPLHTSLFHCLWQLQQTHYMRFVLQVIECKARRCFYVAHAYLATGKQLEAHALFGRAAQHAQLAAKHHQVCTLHACMSRLEIRPRWGVKLNSDRTLLPRQKASWVSQPRCHARCVMRISRLNVHSRSLHVCSLAISVYKLVGVCVPPCAMCKNSSVCVYMYRCSAVGSAAAGLAMGLCFAGLHACQPASCAAYGAVGSASCGMAVRGSC